MNYELSSVLLGEYEDLHGAGCLQVDGLRFPHRSRLQIRDQIPRLPFTSLFDVEHKDSYNVRIGAVNARLRIEYKIGQPSAIMEARDPRVLTLERAG
jgi:hypothetical protein